MEVSMAETIVAPAGLPFLMAGSSNVPTMTSTTVVPPMADIVLGGKGGGAEFGPHDPADHENG